MHPGLAFTQEIQFGFKDSLPWVADCFLQTTPVTHSRAPSRNFWMSLLDGPTTIAANACAAGGSEIVLPGLAILARHVFEIFTEGL